MDIFYTFELYKKDSSVRPQVESCPECRESYNGFERHRFAEKNRERLDDLYAEKRNIEMWNARQSAYTDQTDICYSTYFSIYVILHQLNIFQTHSVPTLMFWFKKKAFESYGDLSFETH